MKFYEILQGDYEFLLKSPLNLLQIFYHECMSNFMRPRIVVDYEREPYIMEAGDVRITFDKNVRAGLKGFDIFDNSMPTDGNLGSRSGDYGGEIHGISP